MRFSRAMFDTLVVDTETMGPAVSEVSGASKSFEFRSRKEKAFKKVVFSHLTFGREVRGREKSESRHRLTELRLQCGRISSHFRIEFCAPGRGKKKLSKPVDHQFPGLSLSLILSK